MKPGVLLAACSLVTVLLGSWMGEIAYRAESVSRFDRAGLALASLALICAGLIMAFIVEEDANHG